MITPARRRAGVVATLVLAGVSAGCGSDGSASNDRDDTTAGTSASTDAPEPVATEEPAPVDTEQPAPVDTDAPEPVATEEPAPVDSDAAVAAAVDVRADGCGPRVGFGSGSVVDGGVVVTAAHVVAGADDVEVIGTDGRTSPATVVVFDPDLDLAVLRPGEPVGTPIPVRVDDSVAGEEGVVVLARRLDGADADGRVEVEIAEVTVVRTARITTTDIYLDDEVVRAGFEIEGSIDPGDSGAMVVLPGGGAGLVWARSNRDERRAWGIDLPPAVVDGSVAELEEAVDTGPCIR